MRPVAEVVRLLKMGPPNSYESDYKNDVLRILTNPATRMRPPNVYEVGYKNDEQTGTEMIFQYFNSKTNGILLAVSLLLTLCICSVAYCCSIPVFRYALEHWLPEAYTVYLFVDSDLEESDKSTIQRLTEGSRTSNIRIRLVELQKEATDFERSIWKELATRKGPRLAVEAPRKPNQDPIIVWDASLSIESVESLLESPTRRKIAQSLTEGVSVSWVFLDGADPVQNSERFELLESELSRLEKIIKLPVIDEADRKELSANPEELKLKFTAMRLSPREPSEQALIATLLATESDLQMESDQGEPIAFPIFGRGRVLYALVGKGIAPTTIEEASRFLAGACQCTVKKENPGVDLLMSFDWNNHIQITDPGKDGDAVAELGGIASNASAKTFADEESVSGTRLPIPPGNQVQVVNSTEVVSVRTVNISFTKLVAVAIGFIALVICGLLFSRASQTD